MTRQVRLGLAQYATDPRDPVQSRAASLTALDEALELGAQVVVLPELTAPGYSADPDLLWAGAETLDGPTVEAWAERVATSGAVVVGGICEREGDQLFNSAVTVGPGGVLSVYRKLHLFADEKAVFAPGDRGLAVVDTPYGRIGACICYDLRFVEVVRTLSLKGAEIVAVPTAWLPGFDKTWWDEKGMAPQATTAMLQANLDQVVIACASAAGPMGDYHFLGSSIVADPWGKLALGPLPGNDRCISVIEIDLDEVERSQHRGPGIDPRLDRRTDVYAIVGADIENGTLA
ncbi:MAG: hydratase [Actinomycetota bacterium]|nr:hydratase [Actinomycetota bacterium]